MKGKSTRLAVLAGIGGILGVLMIGISFAINPGPAPGASPEELAAFAAAHVAPIMWGAWLQAVGPVLIVFLALAVVHLGGLSHRISGWMTMVGGVILVMVSLTEVVFYISALLPDPPAMGSLSLGLAHAVQHLYFMVAAPAFFLPLGLVILSSPVLPRVLGYLALILAAAFAVVGVATLSTLVLSAAVTALAAVQALWWLAAGITLLVRARDLAGPAPAEAQARG